MQNRQPPQRKELKSFWDEALEIKRCPADCKCDHCAGLAELRKREAAERIARNQTRPARRLKAWFPK
jgi:hypothetical protein